MDLNENQNEVIEETKTGETVFHVFLQYWRAGRCNNMIVFTGIIMIFGQIATAMCDFWVSFWYHILPSSCDNQIIVDYFISIDFQVESARSEFDKVKFHFVLFLF